uniref:Uncharacterized protein n=1 Tax=Vibrio tasmaniensis TaxID=212663 RepID=A0A0H3ZRN4_9VIBR|nr:hypothetical protein [Vibrio tasmaniensis]AKN36261.1 hypothetical protein [Vibrio tasmaniensis]AKN36753.1 hypothetical protein [Vibrio tasmaniensis]AKN40807.1 hypothetical protein [Vibrio tasmaniensis]
MQLNEIQPVAFKKKAISDFYYYEYEFPYKSKKPPLKVAFYFDLQGTGKQIIAIFGIWS